MRSVPLGTTGVSVSAICLGAMYLGTRVDAKTSYELLDQYVAAGGSFVDTANIYAFWESGVGGESEELLGRWMAARRNRSRIFLASKLGFAMPGAEFGLRASQVETECDKSLRRLGTDTIDLYYAHVDDRTTPLEETLSAFDRLVRAGKVRFVGASNFRAWRLEAARGVGEANGWPTYCCIQQRHSYLRPRQGVSFHPQVASDEDLLDYCRSRQVTLLAYQPLLAGAYARPDRPLPDNYRGPDTTARLKAIREVAAECGAGVNQVVLAWLRQSEPTVVPVMGASKPEQLEEDLGSLEVVLSPEQMARLNAAGATTESA